MITRPRRLRTTAAMRALVAETRVHPAQLVLPVFVAEGLDEPQPITSLPGVQQHSIASLVDEARRALAAGLKGIMLFGVPTPQSKDAEGSVGWAPDGILNRGLGAVRGDEFRLLAPDRSAPDVHVRRPLVRVRADVVQFRAHDRGVSAQRDAGSEGVRGRALSGRGGG